MARDNDHDAPKKSWRDIDKQRDGSAHHSRRDARGGAGSERLQSSQAYRSYKSQLNKLFDGGGALPEALREKLVESGVGAAAQAKKEMAAAILAANKPKALAAAVSSYREAHGFPDDEAVLAKLLDSPDEQLLLETLQAIARLHEEGTLKRGASFRARIKTVQMTVDEPDVQDEARLLLDKLR